MENSWYGVEASSQRIVTTFIILFFFLAYREMQAGMYRCTQRIFSVVYTRQENVGFLEGVVSSACLFKRLGGMVDVVFFSSCI